LQLRVTIHVIKTENLFGFDLMGAEFRRKRLGGGIGRHSELKTRRPSGYEGSIPSWGTSAVHSQQLKGAVDGYPVARQSMPTHRLQTVEMDGPADGDQ
jgi:hypothetical protein